MLIKGIVFDAFGTLVEITDKRNPFLRARCSRDVMTKPLGLDHFTSDPGLLDDLTAELASVVLYPDVIPVLDELRSAGVKIAVGSNLAMPYGEPLRRLLSGHVDVFHLSYEVGLVKPDERFFLGACEALGTAPADTLMIGDNYMNDFCGAERAGLNAEMILRGDGDTITAMVNINARIF